MVDNKPFTPDVAVLGLPSSGKTVFLSVLGLKFAGGGCHPLGFTMDPADNHTAEVVNNSNLKFRSGRWPAASEVGRVSPLKWNVGTGSRHLFQLKSMDVPGETVLRAFRDEGAAGSGGGLHPGDRGRDAFDADLYSEEASTAAKAAEAVKNAVALAKVVCFFVNVGQAEEIGEQHDAWVKNYQQSVMFVAQLLRRRPEVASKAIVVLTQSHLHRNEILLKGAEAYLGDVNGGYAHDVGLSKIIAERKIPVVAVSAVNEDESSKDNGNPFPRFKNWQDMKSDGLFAFLLIVGGRVAENELGEVRNHYLRYMEARSDYLRHEDWPLSRRLELVRKCRESGKAFCDECERYLVAGNLGSDSLVDDCRRSTVNDEVVRTALEEFANREGIDTIWDLQFRHAALQLRNGQAGDLTEKSALAEIEREVRNKAQESVEPCRQGQNDYLIYGFVESSKVSFESWKHGSFKEYRQKLDADEQELESKLVGLETTLGKASLDMDDYAFDALMEKAKTAISVFERAYKAYREYWSPQGGSVGNRFTGRFDRCKARCSKLESTHAEMSRNAAFEKAKAAERAAVEELKWKRRIRFVACVSASCLLLFLVRSCGKSQNARSVRAAEKAAEECKYDVALAEAASIHDWPLLLLSRDDYVHSNFINCLNAARDYRNAYEKVLLSSRPLVEFKRRLHALSADFPKIQSAEAACDKALSCLKGVSQCVPLPDIRNNTVDVGPDMKRIEEAKRLISEAVTEVATAESALYDYYVLRYKAAAENAERSGIDDTFRNSGKLTEDNIEIVRKWHAPMAAIISAIKNHLPGRWGQFAKDCLSKPVKLPIIVQFEGVWRGSEPVEIKAKRRWLGFRAPPPNVVDGESPETGLKCVYFWADKDSSTEDAAVEVKFGSTTISVPVARKDLVPGINRIEVRVDR